MFYIKQNDTSPALKVILKDSADVVIPVTGASVILHMRAKTTGTVKVSAAGEVVDGAAGIVQYEWAAGDTDTVGDYEAEFQVTFADGAIETFPNTDYIKVRVVEEIA